MKLSINIDITPDVIKVLISSTSLEKYASKSPESYLEKITNDIRLILFSISNLIFLPTPWDTTTNKISFKKFINPMETNINI